MLLFGWWQEEYRFYGISSKSHADAGGGKVECPTHKQELTRRVLCTSCPSSLFIFAFVSHLCTDCCCGFATPRRRAACLFSATRPTRKTRDSSPPRRRQSLPPSVLRVPRPAPVEGGGARRRGAGRRRAGAGHGRGVRGGGESEGTRRHPTKKSRVCLQCWGAKHLRCYGETCFVGATGNERPARWRVTQGAFYFWRQTDSTTMSSAHLPCFILTLEFGQNRVRQNRRGSNSASLSTARGRPSPGTTMSGLHANPLSGRV